MNFIISMNSLTQGKTPPLKTTLKAVLNNFFKRVFPYKFPVDMHLFSKRHFFEIIAHDSNYNDIFNVRMI